MRNMDNKLIEIAKEQCEIFPEDSYMGEYLRETLKMLQAEPCEDAINRQAVLEVVENSCLDLGDHEDVKAFCYMISNLPPVKPVACIGKVNFSKKDMQEIIDKKVEEMIARKKGHWIMTNDYFTGAYGSIDYVKCSCCGEESLEEGNFCPNCGAEMGSEE
jgi:hypothetical protein